MQAHEWTWRFILSFSLWGYFFQTLRSLPWTVANALIWVCSVYPSKSRADAQKNPINPANVSLSQQTPDERRGTFWTDRHSITESVLKYFWVGLKFVIIMDVNNPINPAYPLIHQPSVLTCWCWPLLRAWCSNCHILTRALTLKRRTSPVSLSAFKLVCSFSLQCSIYHSLSLQQRKFDTWCRWW